MHQVECLPLIVFKVLPPAVYLRVTENVHHIVAFIEGIIRNGHAYATKEGERECFILFRMNALFCSISVIYSVRFCCRGCIL